MRTLVLLAFLLLAACGQSGDLYLPAEQPEAEPAPAEAPAKDKDKDKDGK